MVGGPEVFSYKRGHDPTMVLVAELEAALARRDIHVLRDVDTECGALTWGELGQDRDLDPIAEANGGRVDLVDAVLERLGEPDFRDLVVVQGPAGSGKSAFTLRLATRLIDEGLTPVLVRFRDLRRSTYAAVDELLQDAVRVAPASPTPTWTRPTSAERT